MSELSRVHCYFSLSCRSFVLCLVRNNPLRSTLLRENTTDVCVCVDFNQCTKVYTKNALQHFVLYCMVTCTIEKILQKVQLTGSYTYGGDP